MLPGLLVSRPITEEEGLLAPFQRFVPFSDTRFKHLRYLQLERALAIDCDPDPIVLPLATKADLT